MKTCTIHSPWENLLTAWGLADKKLAKAIGVVVHAIDETGVTFAVTALTDNDIIEMERKQREAQQMAEQEMREANRPPLIWTPDAERERMQREAANPVPETRGIPIKSPISLVGK